MAENSKIEGCKSCPLCSFTRSRKKDGFFYRLVRKVQGKCPSCAAANKELGIDFQKSDCVEK